MHTLYASYLKILEFESVGWKYAKEENKYLYQKKSTMWNLNNIPVDLKHSILKITVFKQENNMINVWNILNFIIQ